VSRRCAACKHLRRADLDARILAGGETFKALAQEFAVDPSCLSRHSRKHLQALETAAPVTVEEEIRVWMARSEELWNLAATNADVRGLAQALAQGLRGLEFSLKRKEEVKEQAARELPHELNQWTEAERTRMQKYLDWVMTSAGMPAVIPRVEEGENHESDLLSAR
jgi:hypothetical protein